MKLPKYIVKAYKLHSIKKGTAIEFEETEAIPIEWIEDHIEECKVNGLPNIADAIAFMIEIWRNEQCIQK